MSASVTPKRRRPPKPSAATAKLAMLQKRARQVARIMVAHPDRAAVIAPVFERLKAEIAAAAIATNAAADAAAFLDATKDAAA